MGVLLTLLSIGSALALPHPASSQGVVSVSPDVTIEVGAGGTVVRDEAIAVDNLLGLVGLESLGILPDAAAIVGFGLDVNGDRLFVLDTTSSLPGSVVARAGDVIRYDGGSHSVTFDAQANGIPSGARIDAVSLSPNGLLLSLDTTALLPGDLVVNDEDLFEWDGGSYALRLDGSAAGIPVEYDVDAAQDLGGGNYFLSFDTSGSIAGVPFADEDILRYQSGNWSVEVAMTSLDLAWGPADVEALLVPEPAFSLALLMGAGWVIAASRRRCARRVETTFSSSCALLTACLALLAIATGPRTAQAADGAMEINMTCAETLGCFPGDTPGFPVTITTSGRYRLTGPLALPTANTTGIRVLASHVDIDLAGFEISGPGASGTGDGISNGIAVSGIHVHDGLVSQTGRNCVSLGPESFVARMVIVECGLDGIVVGRASRLEGNVVHEAGDDGIVAGPYSTFIANVLSNVGDNGIVAEGGTMLRENLVTFSGNNGLVVLPNAGSVVTLANNYLSSNGENFDPAITGAIAIAIAPNDCGPTTSSWCFQNQ